MSVLINMEDMKIMTTEQLKNELNAMKNKILIMRIITHGLVILGLVAVPFNFFISLLCWIIAPAFGIPLGRIIKKRNKISNQLADNVIGYVLRDVFGDDVEYDLSGEFKPDKEAAPLYFQVPKGRVWETNGMYNIKAAYNGVNIELGNYYINEMEENHQWNESSSGCTLFNGPWLICDCGRKPECVVSVSTKSHYFSNQQRIVIIDDEQFSKRFWVNAKDPREAFAILTPQMMEIISAVADRSNGRVYISFMPDGKMHIGVDIQHCLFNAGNCRDAEELRKKFSEELRQLTDIIDTLNV